MRVSAPPFTNPCYYGTDIDSRENLIACHHTVEEIAEIIGVDSLGYLEVELLERLIGYLNTEYVNLLAGGSHCGGYCAACFDGNYPTEVPQTASKSRFEQKISEGKKAK